MRNSLDYAGFAQLCGRSPIMRKIMRAHNRIIQRSLASGVRERRLSESSFVRYFGLGKHPSRRAGHPGTAKLSIIVEIA